MEKKYLYTDNYHHGLERWLITRETKSNYWVYLNEKSEEKISKIRMCTGSGFHITHYELETLELKKSYLKNLKYRKYLKKLETLGNNNNEEVWDLILNI